MPSIILEATRELQSRGGKAFPRLGTPGGWVLRVHTAILRITLKALTSPLSGKFYVAFAGTQTRNAEVVGLDKHHYIIIINVGLLASLYEVAAVFVNNSLLQKRDILEGVDPLDSAKRPARWFLHRRRRRVHKHVQPMLREETHLVTKEIESQLIFTLVYFALDFVLKHELAHIYSGHLEGSIDTPRPTVSEFCMASSDSGAQSSQLTELMADVTAIELLLNGWLGVALEYKFAQPLEITTDVLPFTSFKMLKNVWLTSLVLLFLVLGEWDQCWDWTKTSHPFPTLRFYAALANLRNLTQSSASPDIWSFDIDNRFGELASSPDVWSFDTHNRFDELANLVFGEEGARNFKQSTVAHAHLLTDTYLSAALDSIRAQDLLLSAGRGGVWNPNNLDRKWKSIMADFASVMAAAMRQKEEDSASAILRMRQDPRYREILVSPERSKFIRFWFERADLELFLSNPQIQQSQREFALAVGRAIKEDFLRTKT